MSDVKQAVRVFAFMASAHQCIVIDEKGVKVHEVAIEDSQLADNVAQAKNEIGYSDEPTAQGVDLKNRLMDLYPEGYALEWVDDPAGEPALVEACRIMEGGDMPAVEPEHVAEGAEVVGATEEEAGEEVPAEEPKRGPLPERTTAKIAVPISKSEEMLRQAIRDMQNLEMERDAAMKEFNQDIKAAKKRMYGLLNREPMQEVECRIEYDFAAGVKKLYAIDTGDYVRTDPLTDEERYQQQELELPMPEAGEAVTETDAATDGEVVTETESTDGAEVQSTETESTGTEAVTDMYEGAEPAAGDVVELVPQE